MTRELLLEVDRVRRDDDPVLVPAGVQQRRHQVPQRLPDTGARLDRELAAVRQLARDGPRHLHLPGARLVVGEQIRAASRRLEDPGHLVRADRDRIVPRRERLHRLDRVWLAQPLDDRRRLGLVDRGRLGGAQQRLRDQRRGGPARRGGEVVQLAQQRSRQRLEAPQQREEDVARRLRVRQRSVRLPWLHLEQFGQCREIEVIRGRQQHRRDLPGVVGRPRQIDTGARQEVEVELDVLSDDRAIPDEGGELARDPLEPRRVRDIAVGDARQLLDLRRNQPPGVDQRVELLAAAVAVEARRADLRDLVDLRVEPGRLEVERDELFGQRGLLARARRQNVECTRRPATLVTAHRRG